jgi:arsenite methyltransferase
MDPSGPALVRGQRVAVCDKTFHLLQRPLYDGMFAPVEPLTEIPPEQAAPFDCRRSARLHPRETKGQGYDATTATDGVCCGPEGFC